MQIQNLHQPFVFKNDNKINLIVSEYTNQTLGFRYGKDYVQEDYWKLCHLDENYNKTNIITPSSFNINNITYHVIAECNGFVYDNKISYIVSIHPKFDNYPLISFLAYGNFDINTKSVSNVELLDAIRTGFIKDDIFTLNKNNEIIKNGIKIFDLNPYIQNVVRIIPVYNKNKIIATNAYYNNYKSILIDLDNNDVKIIEINNNDNIYKSSILIDENVNIIAYTDKIFNGLSRPEFTLNIEENYTLKNL
jgi:hypothetical protein